MVHVGQHIAVLGKLDEGFVDPTVVAGIDERSLRCFDPVGKAVELRLKMPGRTDTDPPTITLHHVTGGNLTELWLGLLAYANTTSRSINCKTPRVLRPRGKIVGKCSLLAKEAVCNLVQRVRPKNFEFWDFACTLIPACQ